MTGTSHSSFSLRHRLWLIGGLVLVLALGLVGYAMDNAFSRSARAAVAERLESYFYVALAATEVNEDGSISLSEDLLDPKVNQVGSGLYLRIDVPEQRWESPSALGLVLPPAAELPPGQSVFLRPAGTPGLFTRQQSISWELHEGHSVPMTVTVWEDRRLSDMAIGEFRKGLWQWLGGAALLLALSQWLVVYWALKPLGQLTEDIRRIEFGEIRELEGGYPQEVQPLTRNVNRLLRAEYANQKRYRTALDSLAHSLKTPLAVMRTSVESGETSGDALLGTLDDMHTLVAQQLERAAGSTRRTLAGPVKVQPVADRISGSLLKVYHSRQIDYVQRITADADFYGEERDLLEILGNLLDNGFKYGRGRVNLFCQPIAHENLRPGIEIRVEDDGPGIMERHWPKLLRRGVRGDQRADGHGVGLAIVSELVESYHGTIDAGRSDLGGAAVTIRIPPA